MSQMYNPNAVSDMNLEVFNHGPVVIFKWANQPGWPVVYVSGNVGLNFGYSVEAFLNGEFLYEDIIHPMDRANIRQEIEAHVNHHRISIQHEPYRILTRKGDIRWISDHTIITRNEEDQVDYFIGYVFDITDQMEKEKDLKEYKDRYLYLLEATKEGVWDWDMRTNEVFFSNRWKSMLGYGPDEIKNSLMEWEKRVHKDDLEHCYQDIQAHLDGSTEIYENLHRMLNKTGDYIWIQDRGIKIQDDKGQNYRMIGTHKDVTQELKLKDQLIQMTEEDSLTELLNRRAFFRIAKHHLDESRRYGTPLCFLMLDLDHFKKVNDTWGHGFGDAVLKAVAENIQNLIRTTDYAFRLGGEEFGILLIHTNLNGAAPFAERLRKVIAQYPLQPSPEETTHITISIGLAEYQSPMSIDQLTTKADEALYQAKANGRNCIVTSL